MVRWLIKDDWWWRFSTGVETVNLDGDKDLVTAKGTMDVKEFVEYLKQKLKRNIEVVNPTKKDEEKKEKEGGGGEKKEKAEKENKKEGGGGEKKEEGAVAKAVEVVNKMEYQYPLAPSMYWLEHEQFPGQTSHPMEFHPSMYAPNHHYGVEQPGYSVNQGYPVQQPAPFFMHPQALPPPQMFSDENPNACSLM